MAGNAKPKKMLIGGIVIMVIAMIGGITAFVIGIVQISDVASTLSGATDYSVDEPATISGSGDALTIWGTSSLLNCQASDSSGNTVDINTTTTAESTADGESLNLIGYFDAEDGEDYQVTCQGSPGDTFNVVEIAISKVLSSVGLLVGSLIGGFGLFFIGLIFVIIALFRRSSWKKRQGGGMGPGGYQQPPGQQGWAPQPQPGAPADWNQPTGQGAPYPDQGAPPPGEGTLPPPGGQQPPSGNAPTAPGGPPPPPPGPPPAPGGPQGGPPPPPPNG